MRRHQLALLPVPHRHKARRHAAGQELHPQVARGEVRIVAEMEGVQHLQPRHQQFARSGVDDPVDGVRVDQVDVARANEAPELDEGQ